MLQEETMKMYSFLKKFNTEYSNNKQWNQNTITNHGRNSIKWYTNSSKTKEGTGIGEYGHGTKHVES